MSMGQPRHELKFILHGAWKKEFLDQVQFGLLPDPHAGPTGDYRVTSLYYDTDDFQAFYEKLDGVLRRRKFRLRTYGSGEETDPPYFFEIKHRYAQMISKERAKIPKECALKLYENELSPHDIPSLVEGFSHSIAHQVENNHPFYPLRPKVVVSYVRQAWIGRIDPSLRVTFDYNLSAHPPDDYLSAGVVNGQNFLPLDEVVLEVKFDHQLPRWLQRRLVSCGLRPVRYSKYVEAQLSRHQGAAPVC